MLSTACDDGVTKIYDLNDASIGENALWSQSFQEAKYSYQCDGPINQISWSNTSPKKWLGITLDHQMQLLKFWPFSAFAVINTSLQAQKQGDVEQM